MGTGSRLRVWLLDALPAVPPPGRGARAAPGVARGGRGAALPAETGAAPPVAPPRGCLGRGARAAGRAARGPHDGVPAPAPRACHAAALDRWDREVSLGPGRRRSDRIRAHPRGEAPHAVHLVAGGLRAELRVLRD